MKRKTTILTLAGLAMSALSANAAITSFSTANGTTGPNTPPALNSTYGDGVDVALNLGQSAVGTLTFGGITFTNNAVTSATNTVTWATVGGISVGATTDSGATWSTAGNMVSGTAAYNNALSPYGTEAWGNLSGGGNTQTINLTGLDAGRSYLIQLMHGEDRSIGNGFDYIGTLVATDSASNTANASLRFGDEGDSNANVFGLVTLQISGVTGVNILYPSKLVADPGNATANYADRDPSLSGIVISSQAIPEPSAAALLGGLGLLGLLRRRRN